VLTFFYIELPGSGFIKVLSNIIEWRSYEVSLEKKNEVNLADRNQ